MKRIMTIVSALMVAAGLMSGCEKEKGCENYSPWPSANAVAEWHEYDESMLNDTSAYNSVHSFFEYFGTPPFGGHDSILKYYGTPTYPGSDSILSPLPRSSWILLKGYLKKATRFPDPSGWVLVDNPEKAVDQSITSSFATIYPENSFDTTKMQYILAEVIVDSKEHYESFYHRQVASCSDYTFRAVFYSIIDMEE